MVETKGNPRILALDWQDFDNVVNDMARSIRSLRVFKAFKKAGGYLYGIPRGGLPLAVALSHRLDLPLGVRPEQGPTPIILIDDVIETGNAIFSLPYVLRQIEEIFVWYDKTQPGKKDELFRKFGMSWSAMKQTSPDTWIVFPWESLEKVTADYEQYMQRKEGKKS